MGEFKMTDKLSEVDRRWAASIPHEKQSMDLFEALWKVDNENGGYFNWKCGGDGDSGEELLYHLDILINRGWNFVPPHSFPNSKLNQKIDKLLERLDWTSRGISHLVERVNIDDVTVQAWISDIFEAITFLEELQGELQSPKSLQDREIRNSKQIILDYVRRQRNDG